MSLALLLGPKREIVVRVVYSDETGTDGDEKRNPSTIVTALLLNMDHQWKPVRDAVEAAIADVIKPPAMSRYALKGKNIYHQIERGEPHAIELMKRLMSVPRQCCVPVFWDGVHRQGFRFQMKTLRQSRALADVYRPFRLAFQNCVQGIETYVHTAYRDEELLWIHDGGSLNPIAKESLRAWREFVEVATIEIAQMQAKEEVPQSIIPHVTHVADMIYFGDDKESRALQLVDCCCCTIARHLRDEASVAQFYDLLKVQIVDEGKRPWYENAEAMIASIHKALRRRRAAGSS
jgi:uncharacterized protein DUF3800